MKARTLVLCTPPALYTVCVGFGEYRRSGCTWTVCNKEFRSAKHLHIGTAEANLVRKHKICLILRTPYVRHVQTRFFLKTEADISSKSTALPPLPALTPDLRESFLSCQKLFFVYRKAQSATYLKRAVCYRLVGVVPHVCPHQGGSVGVREVQEALRHVHHESLEKGQHTPKNASINGNRRRR